MDARIARISLKAAAMAIADMAMPRVCLVCGRPLILCEKHICTVCAADMPLTYFWQSRDNAMARSFNAMVQRDLDSYEPFGYAAALLFYSGESPYSRIPRQLKYHRNFAAGRFFAGKLGRLLAGSPLYSDVDLVIPVPLHAARKWRRGYNQAEYVAKGIARALGCPVNTAILRRIRRTTTQTRLHRSERYANVRGGFCASAPASSAPRHILLADDVFTTGATLTACQKALRAVFGPQVRISCATLAVVGR